MFLHICEYVHVAERATFRLIFKLTKMPKYNYVNVLGGSAGDLAKRIPR